jgi:hypothetical protein
VAADPVARRPPAGTSPAPAARPAPSASASPALPADARPAPPAGYSGTPLPRKLGIKPGHTIALIGAPAGFAGTLEPLPERVTVQAGLAGDVPLDMIVFFVVQRAELAARLDRLRARMAPACGLWIAWPKRASKVPTDMSDQVVREIALPTGLVDNKVCAIDQVWSGLRLVIRRELR